MNRTLATVTNKNNEIIDSYIITSVRNETQINKDRFIAEFVLLNTFNTLNESIVGLKIIHPDGYECLITDIIDSKTIKVQFSKNTDFTIHPIR